MRLLTRPSAWAGLALCILVWGGAHAQTAPSAAITLYDNNNFAGRSFEFSGAARGDVGRMNDRASSVVINRGRWQLCTDGGFTGQCQAWGVGRHLLTGVFHDSVSSLRRVVGPQDTPLAEGDAILLYRDIGQNGAVMLINQATPQLGGFNDQTSSAEVLGGQWQLCLDSDFAGPCLSLGPGLHSLSGPYHDRVSSVRPVDGQAAAAPVTPAPAITSVTTTGPAATLHEHENGAGRAMAIEAATAHLGEFNDKASSMSIARGRWQLCSDANFSGRCTVWGPGRYNLSDMNDQISSIRRVIGPQDQPLPETGAVSLFENPQFIGHETTTMQAVPNLGRDGIQSQDIEVHGGRWEFCALPHYDGLCVTVGPGRHSLTPLLPRVLSVRPR